MRRQRAREGNSSENRLRVRRAADKQRFNERGKNDQSGQRHLLADEAFRLRSVRRQLVMRVTGMIARNRSAVRNADEVIDGFRVNVRLNKQELAKDRKCTKPGDAEARTDQAGSKAARVSGRTVPGCRVHRIDSIKTARAVSADHMPV